MRQYYTSCIVQKLKHQEEKDTTGKNEEEIMEQQLTTPAVNQRSDLLMSILTNRVLVVQSEPDGVVREAMINNLLIDINCG